MKWFLAGLISLAVSLTVLATCEDRTEANHYVVLPYALSPTPQLQVLYVQGYYTYSLDPTLSAYPGFREQVANVARRYADVTGIRLLEANAGEAADVLLVSPSDATFLGKCGQGAAACVDYYYHPAPIYFRVALGYVNWESTITHELGHIFGQHERYFDNDTFQCDPSATYTQMSCGTGVRGPQLWDRDIIWNVSVPDRPKNVGFVVPGNGFAYVTWDGLRADGGNAHQGEPAQTNVTRMAFGHSDCDGCPIAFVGFYEAPRIGWRGFDGYWRGCIWIRAENAALWMIGQVSAPSYWTKAGCW